MSFDATKTGVSHHNSAVFVDRQNGITARYDKQHLVIFGEYIPLLETFPILKMFSPVASEIVMQPGISQQVFKQHEWEYVPNICYEDTVPQLVSRGVNASSTQQKNKILVNMSNDGWFHGSSEHDQHLITSVFRAVENRAPLVRAVNMGISAIIDGDGAILEPEHFIDGENLGIKNPVNPRKTIRDPQTGKFYRKLPLAQVSTVPLDPRHSFYALGGDWFGLLCCTFVTMLIGVKFWGRK
jgi:apolipoprotein N-acyltransferase